jgi:hypothetical protein
MPVEGSAGRLTCRAKNSAIAGTGQRAALGSGDAALSGARRVAETRDPMDDRTRLKAQATARNPNSAPHM